MSWNQPAAFPAVYEELNVPGFFTEFSEKLLDRAEPKDGDRLLDVATGTGIVLRRALERCPGLGRAVGVDLTPAMLSVAREASEGLPVEYVEGDATALPFGDGSFDLVTCQQGLQFFPDRAKALAEMRRVLAPGGRAFVACWCEIATSPLHHTLAAVVREHHPEREPIAGAPFSFPDGDALRRLVAEAGFESVEVERIDGTARFASAEDFTRSFMEGSPMAIALADDPPEAKATLFAAVAAALRERVGDPAVAPMATHLAVGRKASGA